ncbi:MAG: Cys-Gln thioester bond-forming surface protein [Clostridiales Family XIII bacterium]|jgi:hypothetical protein|nr:Cys-Gln thioester bond-forming surface protein [Clostridiales Family XIII bacterium]
MRCFPRTLATAVAFACALALLPLPVFADTGPDATKYTVRLRYDDSVQIFYSHRLGVDIDGWWTGWGDIPLGGAWIGNNQAIPQIYCVDAAVPFHSYATSQDNIGGTDSSKPGGHDVVLNYVSVSPEHLPQALKSHWNELSWLAVNGYSDADSLAALNAAYPDLADNLGALGSGASHPITTDVAIMATKVAVWRFTNPDVAYYSTGYLMKSTGAYSDGGIKHRQFAALTEALVEGAGAYAANPASAPLGIDRLDISIDGSAATETPTGSAVLWGPYRITDGGIGLEGDDLVFLEAGGPEPLAGGVVFYTSEGGIASSIAAIQKYGKAAEYRSAIKKNEDFYIYVPSANLADLNGLYISALARTTETAVKMPIVLAYQDPSTGGQDWKEVQAFIGLTDGFPVTAYGQAMLPLGISLGAIQLGKSATNINGPFLFRLTDAAGKAVDLNSVTVTPAAAVNSAADGILSIGDGGLVTIGDLRLADYRLTELVSGSGLAASYTVGSGAETPGRTASVQLTGEVPVEVDFTNTSVPPDIFIKKRSGRSGNPDLPGASFTLTKPDQVFGDYTSGSLPTDTRGVIESYSLALPDYPSFAGTYLLTEYSAPASHKKLSGGIAIEVTQSGIVTSASALNAADASYVAFSGIGGRTLTVIIENAYTPTPPSPYSGGDDPPPPVPVTPTSPAIERPPTPTPPGGTVPPSPDSSDIPPWGNPGTNVDLPGEPSGELPRTGAVLEDAGGASDGASANMYGMLALLAAACALIALRGPAGRRLLARARGKRGAR